MTPIHDIKLHPVDVGSAELDVLVNILKRYLPQSITVLGAIGQATPTANAAASPASLRVWTSLPVPTLVTSGGAPPLFAVLVPTVAHGHAQCRLFVSAESSPAEATPEETAFATAVAQEGIKLVGPLMVEDARRAGAEPRKEILIGSIHEKWALALEPLSIWSSGNTKFIHPPRPATAKKAKMALPESATLARLADADIDAVLATSHIQRSRAYIASRASSSVVLRMPAPEGNGVTVPAAWALIHADGSIGSLYVDSAFRRMGLATVVVTALVEGADIKPDGMEGVGGSTKEEDNRGGAQGWFWGDVMDDNGESGAFFGRLDGWERGWVCNWMGFSLQ